MSIIRPMLCNSSRRRANVLLAALAVFAAACGSSRQDPVVQDSGRPDTESKRVDSLSFGALDLVEHADAGRDAMGQGSDLGSRDASPSPSDSGNGADTQTLADTLPWAAGNETGGSLDADNSTWDAELALDGGPTPIPPVTLVVLPDTQYYAAAFPDEFTAQTQWILDQQSDLNIAAVLHVGDVVDSANSDDQWTVASSALRMLDGKVPYVLVPGNHDTDGNRQGLMDKYFGPASMPWVTGIMTWGQIENNYTLIDVGPQRWLVLGLEFGPRDAVMTWADAVLKAYPDLPVIIVTHAYLYADGTRYNVALAGMDQNQPSYQYFSPHFYGYTADQGINDGEQMWQKLVLPNRNVRLVLCGHDNGAARLTSTRPDGSKVHQILSDYQWLDGVYDGYGYLRQMTFDYDKKEIRVRTYSPSRDNYFTDDANQFTLSLEL
jgi:3',5'-cyclic AMP phosphodiesterase CpdA